MKKQKFFEELQELMETDVIIEETTVLKNIPEFTSLAVLSVMAFIDEHFDKTLSAKEIYSITTIKSLMELIGSNQFE